MTHLISLLREACGLEMVDGVLTAGAESAAGRRCYTNPRCWRFGARPLPPNSGAD